MIVFATVSSETDEAKTLVTRWATAEDQGQAGQRRNEVVRQNFLLARGTLRALLAHVTGHSDWHICPDVRGKPQAFTLTGAAGPYISLSHTPGVVACAVSQQGPLGIDIERWRPRDFMAIADYAFGPYEGREVACAGPSAFYRIWTLREAMAKATGEGLIATIDGQDRVAVVPAGYWSNEAWRLFYAVPEAGVSLAIASKGKGIWSATSLVRTDVTMIV